MNTMTRTTKLTHVTAAVSALLALSCSAVCTADAGTGIPEETVKYSDLQMSRTADAARLYARISMAARDVCEELDHGNLSSKVIFHRCVQQAIANAVDKVDQPALYSIYSVKNPAPKPPKRRV